VSGHPTQEAQSPRCADSNSLPAFSAVCTGTAPATFVTPGAAQTTAVSYVPNVYFSFPYVATYFANPGYCSAAVSQCSANYAACTSQLGGSGGAGYAVTIVVPGGGGTTVTAGGGISVAPAAATTICTILFPVFPHSHMLGRWRAVRLTDSLARITGNSLSSAACRGLQQSWCTLTGTSAGGFSFGTETGNAAARPTAAAACAGLVGAVAMGVAGMGIL
jgi:hypothetical protein